MTRLLRWLASWCCCALACSAAGCGGRTSPAGPADTLVYLGTSDANTTNPLFASSDMAQFYDGFVFDGLAEPGPHLSYVPGLATTWASSRDGRTWTVELRDDAPFTDGSPFTSRDVVATWKAMLDPRVGDPYRTDFDFVRHVVAEGPHRVRFDLSRPTATFVADVLSAAIMPADAFAGVAPGAYRSSTFGEEPVGNGPYRLVRWRHDEEAVFERNPRYWRGPARIARIEARTVTDASAEGDAIREGTADIVYPPPTEFGLLRKDPGDLQFISAPGLYTAFFWMNLRRPTLADVAVRRAMNLGWDRRDVVERLYHGSVLPNDSLLPVALRRYHDDALVPYRYDPARARAMLAAAGWRLGADGVRTKGGRRLACTLLVHTSSVAALAAEFQSDMAAIGIAIDVQRVDTPTFLNRLDGSHFDLGFSGWGGDPEPALDGLLDSSQLPPVGNNALGYRNSAVDRDLRSARVATSVRSRRALYDDLQRRVHADAPVVFGFDGRSDVALSHRLDVHGADEPDNFFFWNVYDWTLRSR